MSRIGKAPVTIPEAVELTLVEGTLQVKGPKGALTLDFDTKFVALAQADGLLTVTRTSDSKEARSRHGLYRSLAANLMEGVTNGFSKNLEIRGVGYRAALKGKIFELNLGFSHPVLFDIPEGIEIKQDEKNQNFFTVSGIDKQQVGEVSANIRKLRPPEPYKGKGIRYADEHIVQKAGKSAKKGD